jgi:hypothetical protein
MFHQRHRPRRFFSQRPQKHAASYPSGLLSFDFFSNNKPGGNMETPASAALAVVR